MLSCARVRQETRWLTMAGERERVADCPSFFSLWRWRRQVHLTPPLQLLPPLTRTWGLGEGGHGHGAAQGFRIIPTFHISLLATEDPPCSRGSVYRELHTCKLNWRDRLKPECCILGIWRVCQLCHKWGGKHCSISSARHKCGLSNGQVYHL